MRDKRMWWRAEGALLCSACRAGARRSCVGGLREGAPHPERVEGWRRRVRGREHGLVLRQAQHEACRRGDGFLKLSVGLCLGQSFRHLVRVTLTSLTAVTHPKHCCDAGHPLSEQAQHRDQPGLKRRWGPHSVCACSCRCHGRHCTFAGSPADSRRLPPTNSGARALGRWRKFLRFPPDSQRLFPPNLPLGNGRASR